MSQLTLSRRRITQLLGLSLFSSCDEYKWVEKNYAGRVYRIYSRKVAGKVEIEVFEREDPLRDRWRRVRVTDRVLDLLARKVVVGSGTSDKLPNAEASPRAATVTPRSRIYILDIYGEDRIIAIDGETLERVGVVPTNQTGLVDMLLSPDAQRFYVALYAQTAFGNIPARPAAILVLRANPLALDRRIDLPSTVNPRPVRHAMALSPDGNTLYFIKQGPFTPPVGYTASTLVRFDIPSGRITGELGGLAPGRAFGPLALSADGRMLYSLVDNAVAFIDLTTFSLMTFVNVRGTDLVLHPNGSRLYVAAEFPPRAEVIDTVGARLLAPIRLANNGQLEQVEITSDGRYLFAHHANSGSLFVADLERGEKVAEFPTSPDQGAIAVGPG
jgi:DNA-binding beta-propeller fold protein YncE